MYVYFKIVAEIVIGQLQYYLAIHITGKHSVATVSIVLYLHRTCHFHHEFLLPKDEANFLPLLQYTNHQNFYHPEIPLPEDK